MSVRRFGSSLRAAAAAVFVVGVVSSHALAQQATGWRGVTNNWSDANNWDNGIPGYNNGNIRDLYFGNSLAGQSATSNNDLNFAYNGFRITFQSSLSRSLTLTGNAITQYDFGGQSPKIENYTAYNQTVNLDLSFQGPQGEINAISGDLTFGGGVAGLNGTPLQF